MHFRWVFNHFPFRARQYVSSLAAVWVMGLVFGIVLSASCAEDAIAVMRTALLKTPSPFFLCLITGLPVGIALIALSAPCFGAMYPLLFFSATGYGFCSMLIYFTWGSSAWLLRPMVMFACYCTSVLIWWLIFRRSQIRRPSFRREIWLAVVFITAVSALNILLITPILSELTIYF